MTHTDERPFSCNDCDKSFRNKSKLAEHVNYVHKREDSVHPCQFCDKTFTSDLRCKSHVKSVHKKKTESAESSRMSKFTSERVSCPVCQKMVISKNLSSHLHYHKQSKSRPFICQECSQTFTHASSLKRHALLHTGEKQFTCDVCGKQFIQKVAYETHCKSHTEERLHCTGCNQQFLTKYLLNFHLKSKPECRKALVSNMKYLQPEPMKV